MFGLIQYVSRVPLLCRGFRTFMCPLPVLEYKLKSISVIFLKPRVQYKKSEEESLW